VTKKTRSHGDDLRGANRLVLDAITGLTELIEQMHRTIAGGPAVLGRPLAGPARHFTAPTYAAIRAVSKQVGTSIDLALAGLAPLLGESVPGPERERLLAALNGVLGDYLFETHNPLAIRMRFRHGGVPLELDREALLAALPQAKGRLVVLVHGSCMSDLQWNRRGHDHGAALSRDLGYTPIYLHYNSGLHISANGRELAGLLEQLVAAWPAPVETLAILGHSMGGLVARSACHFAELSGLTWRSKLRKLVCLGAPHHGARFERAGNWFEFLLGVSRYSAPLAKLGAIRSAGVTDLRYGNVLDEHWQGADRFVRSPDLRSPLALPEGVDCYAFAATTSVGPGPRLADDGLVSVDSALGRNQSPALTLRFPEAHQAIGYGMTHLDLLNRPEVCARLVAWLGPGGELR
jgi:pimeloyl-ACP methyl ester carboxylesterase